MVMQVVGVSVSTISFALLGAQTVLGGCLQVQYFPSLLITFAKNQSLQLQSGRLNTRINKFNDDMNWILFSGKQAGKLAG